MNVLQENRGINMTYDKENNQQNDNIKSTLSVFTLDINGLNTTFRRKVLSEWIKIHDPNI